MDDEKFLVVPLGKKSKAITQTVSNETAMEIMELLAEGPLSTSKVAERLGIPLTTAQYNIEKLMEAGLVKVARTKYSEKGREVKLYEAYNRAIIILPGKSGAGAALDALKRYLVLLPIVAVASAIVEYFLSPAPSATTFGRSEGGEALLQAASSPVPVYAPKAAPPLDLASQALSPFLQHPGILFFMGCLLALFLIIVMEYLRYRRMPAQGKLSAPPSPSGHGEGNGDDSSRPGGKQ